MAIALSSINFTSPSLLPTIAGAPSVTIPDMLTMDKENHFNIFFTLDLVVSFNGTNETISSVTFYSSLVALIKMTS